MFYRYPHPTYFDGCSMPGGLLQSHRSPVWISTAQVGLSEAAPLCAQVGGSQFPDETCGPVNVMRHRPEDDGPFLYCYWVIHELGLMLISLYLLATKMHKIGLVAGKMCFK